MDSPSTNVVIGANGDTQTVVVTNSKAGTLVIDKRDSVTNKPLAGVTFKVTTATGEFVPDENGQISSNGIYMTDRDGKITINGVVGALVVTEVKTIPGYTIDPAEKTQTVVVNPNDVQTLHFYNTPGTTLVIRKYIEGTDYEPLSGVAFKVIDGSGAAVGPDDGIYYTDKAGEIVLSDVEPGTTVIAREIKTVEGFVLDGTPQKILIKDGEVQSLTFWNKRDNSLTILKQSTDKTPLPGAVFHVTDEDGAAIGTNNGRYTSDRNGLITITGLQPGQIVIVTEEKAPNGYIKDPTPKTIKIKQGVANSLIFENAKTGCLIINKRSSVDKKVPLEGVTFKITTTNGSFLPDEDGKVSSNGLYYTDENGQIILNSVVGSLVVTEVQSIDGYTIHGANRSQTVEVTPDDTQTLYFYNDPLCSLTISKVDSVTGKPVPNTEFTVKYSDGSLIGKFTTGKDGTVTVTGLIPGSTVVVTETKVPSGYVLNSTPQTIVVRNGTGNTLTSGAGGSSSGNTGGSGSGGSTGSGGGNNLDFENDPKTRLVIEKYITGTTTPLKGVTFLVTESNGQVLGSANGEYTTDENGRIVIEGLEPGVTIIAKEIRSLDGYVLDTTPKTIQIKVGDAQTLKFYNTPIGGLELIKVSESDKTKRLANVTFEIRKMDGGLVDTVTTDTNGRVHVSLDAGNYYAVEIESAKGFKVDATPHYFTIKDNEVSTLTVTNKAFSGLMIHKVDSVTGKGIYGVSFLIYDGNQKPIDQVTTDQNGYVYLDSLDFSGKIYVREMENKGYIADTQLKTFYIKPGETTEITWKNTPIMGQIQIWKKSADDNPINGFPAGTPLEGAVFEIYDKANRLVDTVKSDKNGLAASKLLPLERYTVKEVTAPPYYSVNSEPVTVYLEHEGQIVQIEVRNTSVFTNVSVHKSGYKEVVPGQAIRYDFSDIANHSTVPLDNFYWRDTLPTDAVRLEKIITGTWTGRLSYKVVYRTNTSSDYRTLADNLNTSQSHTLDASSAALGLASNEYVTEVMFLFGRVPAGFTHLQKPSIYCKVLPGLAHEYRFANKTDVGGLWQGNWVMAVDRWVTIIYNKTTTPTLPRTGY